MTHNPNQTHFELFGLPARFKVDVAKLETRYHELQREVHPDRFAAAPQAEQRLSIQLATQVNEAYQALKSPVARAHYLLQLHGVDPQFETNTAMPPDFLDEQLELRESLEAAAQAGDSARLEVLSVRLRGERDALLARVEGQLDERSDWTQAAETLRQLMFLEKFREEIGAAEERLES